MSNKKTSKSLLEIMKAESSEERPSIEEMIQQMDYKLNKKIAILENTMRSHILLLSYSPIFLPVHLRFPVLLAIIDCIKELYSIKRMPASPIFKKGGEHHKYTTEIIDGEEVILVKHPKRDKSIFPDRPHINLR